MSTDTATMRRYSALNAAAHLEGLGVDLPAEVRQALDRHAALVARRSALPTPPKYRTTIAAVLAEDPDADVTTQLARLATLDLERQTVADAIQMAMRSVRSALELNADTIVAAIRTTAFDPAVATLTTAASVGGATVGDLVRAKRHKEAEAVASIATANATLQAALKARDSLYPGAQLVWSPFHLWQNPDRLTGVAPSDPVAAIAAGATPWLATFAELDDAQRQANAARRKRKAAAWTHPNRPSKAPAPEAA